MAVAGSMLINVGARIDDMEKGLNRGRDQLAQFGKSVKVLGGALGASFGFNALRDMARWSLEVAKDTEQVKSLNAATERLNQTLDRLGGTAATKAAPTLTEMASATERAIFEVERLNALFQRTAAGIQADPAGSQAMSLQWLFGTASGAGARGGLSEMLLPRSGAQERLRASSDELSRVQGDITTRFDPAQQAAERAAELAKEYEKIRAGAEHAADKQAILATQLRIAAKAMEEQRKAAAQLSADERMRQQHSGNFAEIRRRMLEMQGAFERGNLGVDPLTRGLAEQVDRARQLIRPAQAGAGAALVAGSAAATSFATQLQSDTRTQNPVDVLKELKRIQEQQTEIQKDSLKELRKILDEGGF